MQVERICDISIWAPNNFADDVTDRDVTSKTIT